MKLVTSISSLLNSLETGKFFPSHFSNLLSLSPLSFSLSLYLYHLNGVCVYVFRREIMNPIETNANIFTNAHYQSNMGLYGLPPAGVITADALLPSYNSPINDPPKTAKKSSDSGLTYTVNPTPYSRKRTRDSINPLLSYPISTTAQTMNKNCSSLSPFSFLGEDISLHLQQQQFDLDRLVSQHVSIYSNNNYN